MVIRGRSDTKSVRKDVLGLTMGIIITVLVWDNLFCSIFRFFVLFLVLLTFGIVLSLEIAQA